MDGGGGLFYLSSLVHMRLRVSALFAVPVALAVAIPAEAGPPLPGPPLPTCEGCIQTYAQVDLDRRITAEEFLVGVLSPHPKEDIRCVGTNFVLRSDDVGRSVSPRCMDMLEITAGMMGVASRVVVSRSCLVSETPEEVVIGWELVDTQVDAETCAFTGPHAGEIAAACRSGSVFTPFNRGYWVLSDGGRKVTWKVSFDPGGSVPDFLVRMGCPGAVPKAVAARHWFAP